MNNFQRPGSKNNSTVGCDFENKIREYFLSEKKINLEKQLPIEIGVPNREKKEHKFDLGNEKIIIECKSHKWTKCRNTPSAKMTVWNEAMYFFHLAPKKYKKYFVTEKDFNEKRKTTLTQYYFGRFAHLIPNDVEIFEFDEKKNILQKLSPPPSK